MDLYFRYKFWDEIIGTILSILVVLYIVYLYKKGKGKK